jgi:hypothetical protein
LLFLQYTTSTRPDSIYNANIAPPTTPITPANAAGTPAAATIPLELELVIPVICVAVLLEKLTELDVLSIAVALPVSSVRVPDITITSLLGTLTELSTLLLKLPAPIVRVPLIITTSLLDSGLTVAPTPLWPPRVTKISQLRGREYCSDEAWAQQLTTPAESRP